MSDRLLFLFAPGAGAPSTSAWMKAWQKRLSELGTVVPFDYPYMREGRRAPDPLPKLIAAHREAAAKATASHEGKLVFAGKSMGSRVGCHASLEEPTVHALVCFGYPLKGAGKKQAIRDEVLLQLRKPILFVQGTRDPLCPLDLLEGVRAKMQAPSTLHVVEGGDHSLNVAVGTLKARGETQRDVDARILIAVRTFLGKSSR
jgi:predicted alpha/beta-hydrolase family hydrolase